MLYYQTHTHHIILAIIGSLLLKHLYSQTIECFEFGSLLINDHSYYKIYYHEKHKITEDIPESGMSAQCGSRAGSKPFNPGVYSNWGARSVTLITLPDFDTDGTDLFLMVTKRNATTYTMTLIRRHFDLSL